MDGEHDTFAEDKVTVNCENAITRYLRGHEVVLNIYAFFFAFVAYCSMYGIRKPFTVPKYEGLTVFGMQYKVAVVIIQVVGYTISKFIGIKYVSEMSRKWRGFAIAVLIGIAEVALVLFAAIPPPYNALMMVLNGLPLGMIWGLTFSYLEGRRWSEVLGTGMALSFVVSSGAVKAVGQALLNAGVSMWWMPAAAGAMFYVPLLVCVFMLESLPFQSAADEAKRTGRVSMDHAARMEFCRTFGPGLVVMVLFHVILTALRDYRDNFATELWSGLGYSAAPSIFANSEIIIAVVLLVPIGCFQVIKSRINSFMTYHVMIMVGLVLVVVITVVQQHGGMPGLAFMVVLGLGVYSAYVPFNSVMFDLLIAVFRVPANCGFMVVVCDALGYLASVSVLLVKDFGKSGLSWLNFYYIFAYIYGGAGLVLMSLSLLYYWRKYRGWPKESEGQEVSDVGGRQPLEEARKTPVPSFLGRGTNEGSDVETNWDESRVTERQGAIEEDDGEDADVPHVDMELAKDEEHPVP